MVIGILILFGVLMVVNLALGISAFFGESASAYVPPYFSMRLVFIGILILVMLVVSAVWTPVGEKIDYLISYISLLFGFIFLLGGITIAISMKANSFWWRLTLRSERGKERQHLVPILVIIGFGFFFCFFLFYPPFLSIR